MLLPLTHTVEFHGSTACKYVLFSLIGNHMSLFKITCLDLHIQNIYLLKTKILLKLVLKNYKKKIKIKL